jgi:hypothetical protein
MEYAAILAFVGLFVAFVVVPRRLIGRKEEE